MGADSAKNDKIAMRKLELHMRMNEARRANNKAVVEEQERFTDPQYEKRRNQEELYTEKKAAKEVNGLGKDKAKYAFEQSGTAEKVSLKKRKRTEVFGWDVFNEDSLYNAYFKRVKKFEGKEGLDTKEDRVQKMADDLEQQIEKRAEFRRERLNIDNEKDIDYINDRNKVFNEKLERNFSKYA